MRAILTSPSFSLSVDPQAVCCRSSSSSIPHSLCFQKLFSISRFFSLLLLSLFHETAKPGRPDTETSASAALLQTLKDPRHPPPRALPRAPTAHGFQGPGPLPPRRRQQPRRLGREALLPPAGQGHSALDRLLPRLRAPPLSGRAAVVAGGPRPEIPRRVSPPSPNLFSFFFPSSGLLDELALPAAESVSCGEKCSLYEECVVAHCGLTLCGFLSSFLPLRLLFLLPD